MIDVNIKTSPCADPKILIGRQAENNAIKVVFDLSFLIQNFGEGTAVLVHQRIKDNAPYIVTTQQDGSTLSWNVSNIDTAYVGVGKAELRWTVGETLAKTITYKTWTIKSITGDEVIPDTYQSWYDAMIDYIDEHCASPEQIEQAVYDYLEEHPIEAPVMSVNSKTGDVVLGAADVGALPDSTTIPTKTSQLQNDSGFITSAPVTSVNSQTGAVILTASDVGAYSKPSDGIPKTDLASAVQTSLGKADTALQTAPVTSVDGKTGAVTVLPSGGSQGQVLKKSSGSDYAVVWANESGGGGAVDSVNGQTGVVVLTASDVGAYSKPSGGIPSTDMSTAVQTSLEKADSALQSVPSTYRTASAQDMIDETKITAPSSPATGAFLVWNGSAWVAQTLATWQGGNY